MSARSAGAETSLPHTETELGGPMSISNLRFARAIAASDEHNRATIERAIVVGSLGYGLTGYIAGALASGVFNMHLGSVALGALAFVGAIGLGIIAIALLSPSRKHEPSSAPSARDRAQSSQAETAAPGAQPESGAHSGPNPGAGGKPPEASADEARARNIMEQYYLLREIELKELGLSPQERAVAAELMAGETYLDAGKRLFLTEHTVKFHAKNIYEKTGTHSKAELARLVTLNMEQKSELLAQASRKRLVRSANPET